MWNFGDVTLWVSEATQEQEVMWNFGDVTLWVSETTQEQEASKSSDVPNYRQASGCRSEQTIVIRRSTNFNRLANLIFYTCPFYSTFKIGQ